MTLTGIMRYRGGGNLASLVFAEVARTIKRVHALRVLRRAINKIRRWANDSPRNCFSKPFLLEAELASFAGKHKQAVGKYACAIALSKS